MATLSSRLILSLQDRVTGPARGVGRSLDRLRRDVGGFEAAQRRTVGGVGASLRNIAALGAGYIGVTSAVRGTVGQAMSFETAMSNVEKVSGLTGGALANMAATLTDLSNKMPMTRNELAELVTLGSQFGVASEYLDDFALTAGRASVAFDMTAADTAENLSVMMNAFGLGVTDLERLTDQINYTADRVGGSESTLMDFLARTGPTATAYGVSAEALLAYGGGLQAMGISAERGATGMNAVVTKMSALTDNEGAVAILDALGGAGYSERLQRKFYETPVDAINELFRVSKSMSAEQRAGFFGEFFGLEYGDDAAAIVSALDKIMEAQDALADSTNYLGGVQRAYDTFASTTANRLKVLGNNLSNIGAAFGAKLLGPIVTLSDKLVATLGSLDQSVSVFDRVGAAASGFFDGLGKGLGMEEGDLGRFFDQGWAAVFGDPAKFEQDTDALTRSFLQMQEWGTWLGQGVSGVGEFFDTVGEGVGAIEAFLNVEPGTAAELLGTLAEGALELAGVGLVLTAAGAGLRALAGGLFVLSGAKMLVGGARGVAGLLGAVAGASALAGGGVAAAAGAGSNGTPRRGVLGRVGRGLGVAGAAIGTDPAWDLGRSMFLGEGHAIDPAIAQRVGDATRARLESQARGEAMRATTLAGLAPQARTFDTVTSALERMRGGADQAKTATDQLGTELGEVGTMTVTPKVNVTSIDAARLAARALSAEINGIGVTARGVGPGSRDPNFVGARASGGPVGRGSYLVGEEGPELVRFGAPGHVFDARDTRSIMDGRAAPAVAPSPTRNTAQTFNFNITVNEARSMSADDLARELGRQVGVQMRSHYSDAF